MRKYTTTFPRKGKWYEVWRAGQRDTHRWFNTLDDAIKYYDERCRNRNFHFVRLIEVSDGVWGKILFSTDGKRPGAMMWIDAPYRDVHRKG